MARRTGGAWTSATSKAERSEALDGPWYSPGARELNGEPANFVPQLLTPSDRERLRAEAKGDELAAAYLAPSKMAFDTAMTSVESTVESGAVAVRVHRWQGTNIYAVSAHDQSWYDCQRQIALFYKGADGKLHYASPGNITDCVSKGDLGEKVKPVMIGGRFAFVDETPDLTAVTSEVGLRQTVYRWQDDHLAEGCALAYRYEVGYVLSEGDEPLNDSGNPRPANVWDVWMRTAFNPWMETYTEEVLASDARSTASVVTTSDDKRRYDRQMARFKAFAGADAARFTRLKAAYDALTAHKVVYPYNVVIPIEHNGQPYLLKIVQQMRDAVYPYIDLILYSADDKPPHRLGNIMVERQTTKLLSVAVEPKSRS
jgi:hemin uptake protein HemP